ncbi:MAG TPA: helix-turn-helix domain-containing protein [Terriglobales bacterium]|nr:helix-turn-helix domain-containing protein [Terriglobales bacterium]
MANPRSSSAAFKSSIFFAGLDEAAIRTIEIHTTNDELSGLADIGRFTASRLLSDWVRAGTVSKGRGWIRLHAPEALMID